MKPLPTYERVVALLTYEPETGHLRWRVNRSFIALAGTVAGTVNKDGYRKVSIDDCLYLASRLIWLLQTGSPPEALVDHRNGLRDDNRWENLRAATLEQNAQNKRRLPQNTSGYKGVRYRSDMGKWQAAITHNGVRRSLGVFRSVEAAAQAYRVEAVRLHGEFARLE